jgi:nucleotide-binding universal stress UspA family protein
MAHNPTLQRKTPMRIVLAVDGSPASTRAARHVAALYRRLTEKPDIIALYVDEPLLRSVAMELGTRGVDRYREDNAKVAFKGAKPALARAGIDFTAKVLVGDPASTIVKFIRSSKCDQLVMGSHGRGAFKNLVLGSVATKILSQSDVPVTIIR